MSPNPPTPPASSRMPPALRNKIVAAAGAGVLAVASVLGGWFEGDGPTVVKGGVTYYRVYTDDVGVRTVCRGITGRDVVEGKLYTQAECDKLQEKHLAVAEAAVKRQIESYEALTIWQQAALIDFTYNLGESNLAGSTMRRLFNAGDIAGGCRELKKWVKGRVKGQLVTMRGLVDRREVERELCAEWPE